MRNFLLLVVSIGVLFKLGFLNNPFTEKQETVVGYEDKVILYSTSWCGYCKKTRDLLKQNNISYTEYDIEESSKGKAEYERLNGRGIPLMVIDGNVIRGYHPKKILKLVPNP